MCMYAWVRFYQLLPPYSQLLVRRISTPLLVPSRRHVTTEYRPSGKWYRPYLLIALIGTAVPGTREIIEQKKYQVPDTRYRVGTHLHVSAARHNYMLKNEMDFGRPARVMAGRLNTSAENVTHYEYKSARSGWLLRGVGMVHYSIGEMVTTTVINRIPPHHNHKQPQPNALVDDNKANAIGKK